MPACARNGTALDFFFFLLHVVEWVCFSQKQFEKFRKFFHTSLLAIEFSGSSKMGSGGREEGYYRL